MDKCRSWWHLCLSFCLFNVERLVINWRRALSFRGSGVAIAYAFSLPYALGAFLRILAALSILWIKSISKLKEDAVIGFIFSTFFALGLLIISLNPTSINVQNIILGNILGIADEDIYQVAIIMLICLVLLLIFGRICY